MTIQRTDRGLTPLEKYAVEQAAQRGFEKALKKSIKKAAKKAAKRAAKARKNEDWYVGPAQKGTRPSPRLSPAATGASPLAELQRRVDAETDPITKELLGVELTRARLKVTNAARGVR